MLHRIKLPVYDHVLERFLSFQEQILSFACSGGVSLPLEPHQIQLAFPGMLGVWLSKKLSNTKTGNKSILHAHLESLIQYCNNHPAEGQCILEAFIHDITFFQHFDDPTFQFHYNDLPDDSKRAIKPLMMEWYQVLYDGFPRASGNSLEKFNRQDLIDAFWLENNMLDVCPACDGQRSRIMKTRAYSDTDHFFPESLYPFLSIHPVNLIPICTDCNRYFKRDIDPIDQHRQEPLIHIFHPYQRPVIDHVDIQVNRSATGGYEVLLLDTNYLQKGGNSRLLLDTNYLQKGGNSRRLQNLNHTFRLQELWESDYLGQVIKIICFSLVDIGASLGDEKMKKGRVAVEQRLMQILNAPNMKIGRLQFYLLSRSYAVYALSNDDELTLLQSQLEGTGSTFMTSRVFAPRSSHRRGTTKGTRKSRRVTT